MIGHLPDGQRAGGHSPATGAGRRVDPAESTEAAAAFEAGGHSLGTDDDGDPLVEGPNSA